MTKNKNWIATYLLCWFFGILGVHRFYTGYIGIGLVQLFTFGGLGIWALIDFITLSLNNYKDADGNCLEEYCRPFGIIGLILLIFGAAFAFLTGDI